MEKKEFIIRKMNNEVLYYDTTNEMYNALMNEVGWENFKECGRTKYIEPEETNEGE